MLLRRFTSPQRIVVADLASHRGVEPVWALVFMVLAMIFQGFRVHSLGGGVKLRVEGLGFGVSGLMLRLLSLGYRSWGVGFGIRIGG
jgi:hypothetical protein